MKQNETQQEQDITSTNKRFIHPERQKDIPHISELIKKLYLCFYTKWPFIIS